MLERWNYRMTSWWQTGERCETDEFSARTTSQLNRHSMKKCCFQIIPHSWINNDQTNLLSSSSYIIQLPWPTLIFIIEIVGYFIQFRNENEIMHLHHHCWHPHKSIIIFWMTKCANTYFVELFSLFDMVMQQLCATENRNHFCYEYFPNGKLQNNNNNNNNNTFWFDDEMAVKLW